jgi:hypothetical protein
MDKEHSTNHEIKFIDKLGTYSDTDIKRRDLLIGYISGCKKRNDWVRLMQEMLLITQKIV